MYLPPKKSLGQHFLNSKHVLKQIINAANIKKGETILEIGPGTGILTEALSNAGAKVIAVEKDERAHELLRTKFFKQAAAGDFTLIHGDILEDSTDFIPKGQYSIVANIPYYITGAILQKFLECEYRPDKMILLVQKEVANRIVAKDGKESILSISVKAFGTPKIIATVPPGAFTPPPTVDSAILAIENIKNTFFAENNLKIDRFFEIVRAGFAHKRKFLISNLKSVMKDDDLKRIWQELGLDPKIRAEDLTKDQWLKIGKCHSFHQNQSSVIPAKAGIQCNVKCKYQNEK